jgi:hypothetical protein
MASNAWLAASSVFGFVYVLANLEAIAPLHTLQAGARLTSLSHRAPGECLPVVAEAYHFVAAGAKSLQQPRARLLATTAR